MTLKELLDLKILRDNALILEFVPDTQGLGSLVPRCDCVRSVTILDEQTLVRKGLEHKYFDYEVKELWGSAAKFKVGIVIEKPKDVDLVNSPIYNYGVK